MPRPVSLALAACLAGCAPGPEIPSGKLEVALVATAPGGTTYRLPPGARLEVRSGAYLESFSLDGDTAAVVVEVPVGEAEVRLVGQVDYGTRWPLVRVAADGTTTNVTGTLLTPQPLSVVIEEDTTISLVLTFQVANSGVITFLTGSLAVSAEVDEVAATGADLSLDASELEVSEAIVHPAAPPEIDEYWPAAGTGGLFAAVIGGVGKWTLRSSTRACAELELVGIGGSPSTSLTDLLAEASPSDVAHGDVEVCIEAQGAVQLIQVSMQRRGPAVTPVLGGLGQRELHFTFDLEAELAEPVLEGNVLHLERLDGMHAHLPYTTRMSVLEILPDGEAPWYSGTLEGTGAISFQPTSD